MTHGTGSVNGTASLVTLHQVRERGLTNGTVVEEPDGLEVRVELVNGLSVTPRSVDEELPTGWSLSAWRKRAIRRALEERAGLPGNGGGDGR